MVELTIDGNRIKAPKGMTVLDAARNMGIFIPTLCYEPGISIYGSCRVCIVEVIKGKSSSLEASCTLPAMDGQMIRTNSEKVKKVRNVIIELLFSSCPNSKKLQDLASNFGVKKIRFKIKDKNCILCGRCVRFCKEQMQSGGLGFVGRGAARQVSMPFGKTPEVCRNCGGCEWICPVCERACLAGQMKDGLCSGCINMAPVETCMVCVGCSQSVGAAGHRVY